MRLDVLMTEKKLARSRNTAAELIKGNQVKVDGKIITKPAKDVPIDSRIEVLEQPKYVGRGGLKLEQALIDFKITPLGFVALDAGSSTGGFTDCLLQYGAQKIYAVDVGTNQLAQKLKDDPRVISLENTDIRAIKTLPLNLPTDGKSGEHFSKKNVLADKIDLAVIDVSFISLKLILKDVAELLKKNGKIIALVKPQFETERQAKNRKGVVKSEETREKVLLNIQKYCQESGLKIKKQTDSPILGGSGNKEYLVLLEKIM